jgi:hypothetical protein
VVPPVSSMCPDQPSPGYFHAVPLVAVADPDGARRRRVGWTGAFDTEGAAAPVISSHGVDRPERVITSETPEAWV